MLKGIALILLSVLSSTAMAVVVVRTDMKNTISYCRYTCADGTPYGNEFNCNDIGQVGSGVDVSKACAGHGAATGKAVQTSTKVQIGAASDSGTKPKAIALPNSSVNSGSIGAPAGKAKLGF